MPNPSELQRIWEEEEIERRSKALSKYADSKNKISLTNNAQHHEDCARLRWLLKELSNKRHPKSVKEDLLTEVRRLEKITGFEVGNYNSSGFGSAVR